MRRGKEVRQGGGKGVGGEGERGWDREWERTGNGEEGEEWDGEGR